MDIAVQITLSVLLAFGLSWLQYLYRSRRGEAWRKWLFLLRGLSYFLLLLLLLNPRINKTSFSEERPDLMVAVDNSISIRELKGEEEARKMYDFIRTDPDLSERFHISFSSFDSRWRPLDSLDFQGADSRIDRMLQSVRRLYSNRPSAWVLITDGNQSEGEDYEYFDIPESARLFPVVVGDTTHYEDIRINYVEANRYTFLENTFPVRTSISYNGRAELRKRVTIDLNGRPALSKVLQLSPSENTAILEEEFTAEQVGPLLVKVRVEALEDERSIENNRLSRRIEVIDERKRIAIVSALNHPDLGALLKVVNSNLQRESRVVSPAEALSEIDQWDAFILYQPDAGFGPLFERINTLRKGYFLLSGLHSDWNFINRVQDVVTKTDVGPAESFLALPGESWNAFNRDSLDLTGYPELQEYLGNYVLNPEARVLLQQRIQRINTTYPMLFLTDEGSFNRAFLIGEGIWKWRAQSYRDRRSFDAFDRTLSRIIRFISESGTRNRLQVEIPDEVRERSSVHVRAVFFNSSFEIDPSANMSIRVDSRDSDFVQVYPFSFGGREYTTSLEALPEGSYRYTVYVDGEDIRQSGVFSVEAYEPEMLWTRANVEKLDRFARESGGHPYFPSETEELKTDLLVDPMLAVLRTRTVERKPLIDFILLLLILSGTLSGEWFIRKFNGLF